MKIPASLKFSNKHVQIDRSYAKMVIAIAAAASIVIFSLVVSNSLINQIKYKNKVIGLKSDASKMLEANVKAIDPLVTSYRSFDGSTESVLGNSTNNSKIVLDALPSKYDFPALASSLEYLVLQSGMTIKGITGTDNEASAEQNSATPKAIEIPFELLASGNYENAKKLINNLEKSIRPISVQELIISGSDGNITLSVKGKTYYQPEKKLEIKEKTVTNGSTTVKKTTSSTTATGSAK